MKKTRNTIRLASIWPLVWVLAQSAQAGGDPEERTRIAPPKRIPAPIPEQTLQPAGEPVAIAAVPRSVRRAVVAAAARRFQLPESAVVLVRAEQVTWSDGSLGCPQPGTMYTQALVPGFRVIAKSPSSELVYHSDERGNVVTCGVLPRSDRDRSQPAPQPGVMPDR